MKYFLLSILCLKYFSSVSVSSPPKEANFDFPSQISRPLIISNQVVEDSKPYKEYIFNKKIENVRAEAQLSLGGHYVTRVRKAIQKADQFVVAFMYRFNHPALIQDLANKSISLQNQESDCIPLVFLDYNAFFNDKINSPYRSYVRYLSRNVPLSFVRIQKGDYKYANKKFHHKIIICKERLERAVIFMGSANATYEADNHHSEDTLIVQSNELAYTILKQFMNLLNSSTMRVFDEYPLETGETNQSHLKKCLMILEKSRREKPRPSKNLFGYQTNIEALAISGGLSDYNSNVCLKLVENDILTQQNKLIIYFENFFNINHEGFQAFQNSLSKSQKNKHPYQLIVRWNDIKTVEKNEDFFNRLENRYCHIINFAPYTKGKFHHKAIIQYPREGDPLLYTGSFNISEAAIKQNSETIVGVKSRELVEDYLSSLLWNSNLTDEPSIWEFFYRKYVKNIFNLDEADSKLFSVASKTFSKCQKTMEKYPSRLNGIINRLKETLTDSLNFLEENKNLLEIKNKKLDLFKREFELIQKDFQEKNDKFQLSDSDQRFEILNGFYTQIKFLSNVSSYQIIDEYLGIINKYINNIHKLESWQELRRDRDIIDSMNIVIKKQKKILKDTKDTKDKKRLKFCFQSIQDIHDNLKELILSKDSFSKLKNLFDVLERRVTGIRVEDIKILPLDHVTKKIVKQREKEDEDMNLDEKALNSQKDNNDFSKKRKREDTIKKPNKKSKETSPSNEDEQKNNQSESSQFQEVIKKKENKSQDKAVKKKKEELSSRSVSTTSQPQQEEIESSNEDKKIPRSKYTDPILSDEESDEGSDESYNPSEDS